MGRKRPQALILDPAGVRLEEVDQPLGPEERPWLLEGRPTYVYVVRGDQLVPLRYSPARNKNTPSDLYSAIVQQEIRELLRPASPWLERIEKGVMLALVFGLGFLLYIFWSSMQGA